MDDALPVCRLERVRDFDAEAEDLGERQRAARETCRQRLALEQFEHQIVDVVLAADVVQAADVRVVERGDGFGLAGEARAELGVGRQLRRENLHRDRAVQARVARPIHLAHAPGADERNHFIRAEPCAGLERHVWRILSCGRTGENRYSSGSGASLRRLMQPHQPLRKRTDARISCAHGRGLQARPVSCSAFSIRAKGGLMTCLPTSATLAAVLLVTLLRPSPLRADPITVTGGTVQVETSLSDARLTFVGEDFLVRTVSDVFITNVGPVSPFPTGTTVDLGGQWGPGDLRGGDGTFNGVHYDTLYFGNSQSGGTFTTPSITITGEGGLQIVELPFTFSGFVTAFSSPNAAPEDVVFTTTLVGRGTARAAFFGLPPEDGFPAIYSSIILPGTDYQLEYLFSPASASVPEPGTLTLLGSGALLLIGAGHRRRSRRGLRR